MLAPNPKGLVPLTHTRTGKGLTNSSERQQKKKEEIQQCRVVERNMKGGLVFDLVPPRPRQVSRAT